MVAFVSWVNKFDKVSRVTLLNSFEPVLAEESISLIKESLGSDCGYLYLTGDNFSWDLVSQNALTNNRLITVRNAELINDWSPVKSWINSCRQSNNYLVFSANWKGDALNTELISLLHHRSVSVVVDCKISNDQDLVKWIKTKVTSTDSAASYLVSRTNGGLLKISNVCNKLRLVGSPLSMNAVDLLVNQSARDSFVGSLVLLDKKSALLEIENVLCEDYTKIIGQLSARLDAIVKLRAAAQLRISERDLAQRLGRGYYYAHKKFMNVVPKYDAKTCSFRYQVLAVADDAVHRGARDGILESLTVMW